LAKIDKSVLPVCDGETKRAALKLVCETSSSLFASMPNASGQARTLARAVFLSGILNPAALARIESAVKAEMERMDGGGSLGRFGADGSGSSGIFWRDGGGLMAKDKRGGEDLLV